ncbi:MAG: hypothetical protein JW973_08160 [Bacteroidales bacterium]|nr:hypothetical protein [Bacteroidales bacterium]
MKKLYLLFLFVSPAVITFSQDILFKTTGEEIQVRIVEIGANEIKYKKYDYPEGPVYIIAKNQVFMIKYENGNKDVFGNPPTSPGQQAVQKPKPSPVPVTPKPPAVEPPKSKFYTNRQHLYFALAAGYGNSYGGYGLRVQGRFGGTVGFGIHAGTGYLPLFMGDIFESAGGDQGLFMMSGGLKFFVYKGIYINTQFGRFGKKWVYDYYYNYYDFYYDEAEEILYGPSFMTGVDWIFGKHFGFNAAVGISIAVEDGYYRGDVFSAVDLGFVVKF